MDWRCSTEPPGTQGFSFSAAAGPLPPDVIDEVAAACRNWRGGGSILALPFTTAAYRELQDDTEARLRRLLAIPADFRVLFMHSGASAQFAAVPLNLLGTGRCASYVETGHWSRRAIAEAARYGEVTIAASAGSQIPAPTAWLVDRKAAYCHITSNETADGLQYADWPAVDVPLVADATSDFLTRPIDFSRVALAYAGTQKSIGVAGLTVVIVRADLLGRAHAAVPRVLNYAAQAEAGSRLSTPPVFAVFVANRMLDWIERHGGVPAMAAAAARRSAAVYAALDASGGLYRSWIAPTHRSRISPCFRMADAALTGRFLNAAEAAGLRDLGGHPQVGGIRVSLYNGTPDAAVDALLAFLDAFRHTHG